MSVAMPRALSVLLVEDSPADGRLLLEAVRPATSAGELVIQTVKRLGLAIEALKTYDFNCVLLDLGLPDGRGVDSVRALREVDRKTAIIVLTGLDDEQTAGEALALGAQDYLVKGECDGEQLIKQLRRAVQRNRQMFAMEQRRDQAFFETSHDALTLLPNAALFLERARQQLFASRAVGLGFALGHVELVGLAALRERQGAIAVDDFLKTLARRGLDVLGAGDTFARLGDAEFGLLRQAGPDAADWSAVLGELRRQFDGLRQETADGNLLRWRIGTAQAGEEAASVETLLAQAKASVEIGVDEASPLGAEAPFADSALSGTRWQPWVDISTRRCVGVQLLPASHEADGIAQSIAAIAGAVGAQMRLWRAQSFEPQTLALSVATAALEDEDFADALSRALEPYDLPARQIQLHIGESVFRQLDRHAPQLSRLRSLGFGLVMDGDGTKDISLLDFAAFPMEGYRLSAALVQSLADQSLHGSSRRLVSAILGAAQQLGAVVIAAGVDDEASLAALRLIGVRLMQGQALLAPMSAGEVAQAWAKPVV